MKVIQIHNYYRHRGGEEAVVEVTTSLLRRRGIDVLLLVKNSINLNNSYAGRFQAFINGIYSISSYNLMIKIIKRYKPDLVHIHNIYPLFSPSILIACRSMGVPTVMTYHNYRLTCPTGFHFQDGDICEDCIDKGEYWCVLKNCRSNMLESVAYFLRAVIARKFQIFSKNLTVLIAISKFMTSKLVGLGFKENQIFILPNMVSIPELTSTLTDKEYIAYAGHITEQKGIDILLKAMVLVPELKVHVAGNGPLLKKIQPLKNLYLVGWLDQSHLSDFYKAARFFVFPSKCFEGCPVVILEAMSHGLPVIASRIGGIPEIVEHGETGLLFEPGNVVDLANKMKSLWYNTKLCKKMGIAAREKVICKYSEKVHFKGLINIYERAIEVNRNK